MNYGKNGHKDGFIGYSCVSVAIDPGTSELKSPFPLGNLSGKLITIPTVHGLCWNNNLYKLGDTLVIHYHLPTVKTTDLIKKQNLVLCSTYQCHLYL